jgi:hypothetical protein
MGEEWERKWEVEDERLASDTSGRAKDVAFRRGKQESRDERRVVLNLDIEASMSVERMREKR